MSENRIVKLNKLMNEVKTADFIVPAIETLEDMYTFIDVAFDDAYKAISESNEKDAKKFAVQLDKLETAMDNLQSILKKYK